MNPSRVPPAPDTPVYDTEPQDLKTWPEGSATEIRLPDLRLWSLVVIEDAPSKLGG